MMIEMMRNPWEMVLPLLMIMSTLLKASCYLIKNQTDEAQHKRPNIIFILADDLGWNDVGYHNVKYENEIKTPHIDGLSRNGVRLENYYVQSICTPTRSVLLTGKYQIHTGLQHSIIQSGAPSALGREHRTIAEELKSLGYATHMAGKWHLGYYKKEFQPLQRGFDTFYGFFSGAEYYFSHVARCEYPDWECQGPTSCWGLDFFDQDEPVYSSEGAYSTDLLTARAVEIIRQHGREEEGAEGKQDKPMFLYLPYQAVHGRLQAPPEDIARFKYIEDEDRRTYAAMVWKLDEGVGNVTKALKEAGIYNDTIIIFSTDNGGDIHFGANNWPLRGWKGSMWEGGIRGIGFVHSPLLAERGVVRKDLIHVADWFPTISRLAGRVNASFHHEIDGIDQWETISRGKPTERGEILLNIDPVGLVQDPLTGTEQAGIRSGHFKLLLGNPGQFIGHDGWIPSPHYAPTLEEQDERGFLVVNKSTERSSFRSNGAASQQQQLPEQEACYPCVFIHENLTTGVCLFNIEEDPEERCNLAPILPQVVEQLLIKLQQYNETALPPQYPPPSTSCDPALYNNTFVAWGDIERPSL